MAMAELMHATGMVEPLAHSELCHMTLDAGHGLKVQVASDPCNSWGYALGHTLWSSAPELITFLAATLPEGRLRRSRVVELGAGLGAVGNALALHGADVSVTDLPACMELLRYNASLQGKAVHIKVQELIWGEPLPWGGDGAAFDLILGSDLCYDSDLFPPLLNTICQLIAHNPAAQVIMALPDRGETREFFPVAVAEGFRWRVLRRVVRNDCVHPIHIYQLVPACPPTAGITSAVAVAGPAMPVGSPASRVASAMEALAAHLPDSPVGPVSAKDPQMPEQVNVLTVWDFDWSMVDDNSDTWVIDKLGARPSFDTLKETLVGWTELMDQSLAAAAADYGATEQMVRAAARSVPLSPDVVQAIKDVYGSGCVQQVILSDANSVFIEEILAAHQLQGCIMEVHTNPAVFKDGALRVSPCQADHACELICPDNMCKGKILERLLLEGSYTHVVYIGDGRNDLCPCTRLGPGDAILARSQYPDGRPAALLRLLRERQARVVPAEQPPQPPPTPPPPPAATAAGASARSRRSSASSSRRSSTCSRTSSEHSHVPLPAAAEAEVATREESHLTEPEVAAVKAEEQEGTVEGWPARDVAAPVHGWADPADMAHRWLGLLRGFGVAV